MASPLFLFSASFLAHAVALFVKEGAPGPGRVAVVGFAWLSLVALGRCLPAWFTNHPRFFTAAAIGLSLSWFYGPLAVRLSPLPLATALAVIGLVLLVLQVQSDLGRRARRGNEDLFAAVTAGFLFALAFSYERLFAAWVLGAIAWSLRYGDRKLLRGIALVSGLLAGWLVSNEVTGRLAPVLGFIDASTALPWTDEKTVAPQSDFLWRLIWLAGPPNGLFVVLGPALSWWLKPRFSLTWVSVPYFLLFLWRGQGEASLLFPLAPLVPIQLVMAARALGEKYPALAERARRISDRGWTLLALAFAASQIGCFVYWARG